MVASLLTDIPTLTNAMPWLGSFLGAVAIIGLLSMVTIQLAKDFFPLRFSFQSAWIREWIRHRLPDDGAKVSDVKADLTKLASASDIGRYLFNLPVEQLCGQINAALQAALEDPQAHEPLIRVFASTARGDDLAVFFGPRPSLVINENTSELTRREIEGYAQARNRVAHQAERAVDNLQIMIGSRWKLILQTAAIGLSLMFAALGMGMYQTESSPNARIRDIFAIGLIAGYLAPVARDILAKAQQRDR